MLLRVAAALAKTARFSECIPFLSGMLLQPLLRIDQHVVGVFESLLNVTVEPAKVISVLQLASNSSAK